MANVSQRSIARKPQLRVTRSIYRIRRSKQYCSLAAKHAEWNHMTISHYIHYYGEAKDRGVFLNHYLDVLLEKSSWITTEPRSAYPHQSNSPIGKTLKTYRGGEGKTDELASLAVAVDRDGGRRVADRAAVAVGHD